MRYRKTFALNFGTALIVKTVVWNICGKNEQARLFSSIRNLICASAMILLSSSDVKANESDQLAKQYLDRHNVSARQVTRELQNQQRGLHRTIHRKFVPILPNTAQDFVKTMSGDDKGTMILFARPYSRYPVNWHHYQRLVMAPDLLYSSHYDDPSMGKMKGDGALYYARWINGSRYVVIDAGQSEKQHMVKFLDRFHAKISSYTSAIDNYKRSRGKKAGDCSADCMWWLTNGEFSEKKNWLSEIGLKRSRGPQEIPALLMHAAPNEKVCTVGVCVNDIDEFNDMTNDQLFGNEPTNGGGAAGSIRPFQTQKDQTQTKVQTQTKREHLFSQLRTKTSRTLGAIWTPVSSTCRAAWQNLCVPAWRKMQHFPSSIKNGFCTMSRSCKRIINTFLQNRKQHSVTARHRL